MSEVVAGLLQGLDGLPPGVLYLLAGLFTALETSVGIGLLIPGDSVVLLAGTTATTPHRFAALVAATVLGSLIGESIGYLLGRRYGSRLRTSRVGRRLGEHRWAAAEAFLAGRGGRAVAAARFVALVHALVPVVAGTVGMSYRRLVGWGAVGAVAWSMLYVGIGAAAGASWRQYGDRIGLAGLAVLGAALAILLVVRAARRGPGRPDHRVGPRPSARSQPERVHADADQKDRAELPIAIAQRSLGRLSIHNQLVRSRRDAEAAAHRWDLRPYLLRPPRGRHEERLGVEHHSAAGLGPGRGPGGSGHPARRVGTGPLRGR